MLVQTLGFSSGIGMINQLGFNTYYVVMDNRISLDFLFVCQDRMCENINESSHGRINVSGQMEKSIQKLKQREN